MSRPATLLSFLALAATAAAQQLPEAWADGMDWRSIGPATMGGRIVALAVYEQDPSIWWAATASGGLVKTTNNGISFEHQFDREAVVSIGHVAVAQSDPAIVWVGTGEANPRNSVSYGNGVYKSTDGGTTWQHMGLEESFQTGRIAIHPTDPDTVYVGALGRLYGDNEQRGLYKTTDGGTTWTKVLHVDDRTGVIDVDMHPTDPDTLLVATYERMRDGFDTNDPAKKYGPGSGIWRTTDGGTTWQHVKDGLPTNDLGRIGIDWYRKDPSVVMALVECEKIAQQPEDAPFLGASLDEGDAGVKITAVEPRRRGNGRGGQQRGGEPRGGQGRSGEGRGGEGRGGQGEGDENEPEPTPAARAGLKPDDVILKVAGARVHTPDDVDREIRQHKAGDEVTFTITRDRQDHEIVVALGEQPENARSPFTGTLGGQAANLQDRQGENGHEYGGLYKSTDGGVTWARVNTLNPRPMYYSQVRIDPSDCNNVMVLGTSLWRSTDGGVTFRGDAGRGIHVDHHAQWIDPNDGDHIIHGCDGGIYVTYDACRNWDHLNHVAIGQFYHVGAGPDRNYRVFGGLQDNGSWGGPSRTSGTGATNEDWLRVGGGDGFRCLVDPDDRDVVYAQSQNGPPSWRHLETGERGSLRSRGGGRGGRDDRGDRGGERERTRFNWETPYILSAHNSRIVYTAGNKVFKSLNRGAGIEPISPDVTNTDRGSATALAESPRDADIVYVGSDDGALWVTRDGGDSWVDCFAAAAAPEVDPNINATTADAGARPRGPAAPAEAVAAAASGDGPAPIATLVPGPRWVSEIAASQHAAQRAYVTLDGHRSDDDAPYVFVTEDAGATWRSLTANLPAGAGSTRTIVEDPVNENVLYLGTEFRAYVSLDRGEHWTCINGDLPTVAVHGFAINVPSGEIVAATHGRSLWIADVNELRQMTAEVLAEDVHFYRPVSAVIWKSSMSYGGTNRRFTAENPPSGARLVYHLKAAVDSAVIEVLDSAGKVIRTIEAATEAGLHTARWDLRGQPQDDDANAGRRFRGRAPRIAPGTYTVRLTAGGAVQSHPLQVEIDPDHPDPRWIQFEAEAELLEAELQAELEELEGEPAGGDR